MLPKGNYQRIERAPMPKVSRRWRPAMTLPMPPIPPFELPERQRVTLEPPQLGYDAVPEHNDREWLAFENQGGGSLPEEHDWTSNPKERQDEIGAG